jgi:hypothetical protein
MVEVTGNQLWWYADESKNKGSKITRWEAKPNPYSPKVPTMVLHTYDGTKNSRSDKDWEVIKNYTEQQSNIAIDTETGRVDHVHSGRNRGHSLKDVVKSFISEQKDPFFEFIKTARRGDVVEGTKKNAHSSLMYEKQLFVIEDFLHTRDGMVLRPLRSDGLYGDPMTFSGETLAAYSFKKVDFDKKLRALNPEVSCEDQYELL